jgi:hypothetical protein
MLMLAPVSIQRPAILPVFNQFSLIFAGKAVESDALVPEPIRPDVRAKNPALSFRAKLLDLIRPARKSPPGSEGKGP